MDRRGNQEDLLSIKRYRGTSYKPEVKEKTERSEDYSSAKKMRRKKRIT